MNKRREAAIEVLVSLSLLLTPFFLVWFPYGFIVGDLTINPMLWAPAQRATLVFVYGIIAALVCLSAAT